MGLTKGRRLGGGVAVFVAVVAVTLADARPALAQGGDAATALTLFEAGKRLASEGNYGEACPKFLASYGMVQKLGTLLNLADCYERAGKAASAWARFTEAATVAERSGQQERADFARAHAAALAPRLSRLQVDVPSPATGLVVSRDGTPLDASTFGIAIPVDPGEHKIEAAAPGKVTWSTNVVVGDQASTAKVQVPSLVEAATTAPPPPVTTPPPKHDAEPPPSDSDPPGKTQRTIGVVLGAVGLAGVVASVGIGAIAKSNYADSNGPGLCLQDACTKEGLNRRSDASSMAGIATGAFIGGLALVATGVIFYVVAPSRTTASRPPVWLANGGLGGAF